MLHDNAAFSSRLHSSWPCVLASKIDGIIFYVDVAEARQDEHAKVGRRLPRSVAGRPRTGDRRPVPEVIVVAAAATGAGEMTDVVIGSVDDIPVARAARSPSTESRSRSSGCGTARCVPSTRCARTGAGHWQTGWPTTGSWCVRCTATHSTCAPEAAGGAGMSVRSYSVSTVEGAIRVTPA
jgi:hypothetical protein